MRKRKIILLTLLFLVLGYVGYLFLIPHHKMKIERNKSKIIYAPETSEFNFPVYLSIKDIELLANKKVKKILIDKTVPAQNQKDSLKVFLERTSDLKFKMINGNLHSELSVHADIGYIKKWIGNTNLKIGVKHPISFDLIIRTKSTFQLDPSIQIKTKTTIDEIVWTSDPTTKIAGIPINLKKMVEEILQQRQDELTQRLDEILKDKINLKKPITKIWNNLQKGIKASKHQEDLFIRIQPHSIAVNVDKSNCDSLKLNLHILGKIYGRFNEDTLDIKKLPLPKKVEILKEYKNDYVSNLSIHLKVPIEKLNEIVNDRLVGQTFNVKGYTLKIKKIKAINGIDGIYCNVKIGGDFAGEVWLKGKPKLIKNNTILNIENVDIETKFKDKIFHTIGDMFNKEFRAFIDSQLYFDIGNIMSNITTFAQDGVQKTKFGIKNKVDIDNIQIKGVEVKLTKDNIQILINGSGQFGLAVKKEGLKLKKFEFKPENK